MEQSAGGGRGKGRPQTTLILGAACALSAALCLAIPLYVIRPFRPQGAREMALALTVRDFAPWISGLCAAVAILLLIWSWKVPGLIRRISMVAFSLVALLGAVLTHINIFEIMFHPYDSPAFSPASEGKLGQTTSC
jgi:drug/metabolite transporter (DMT)-like permease